MNENTPTGIGVGYAFDRMAQAFLTALTHRDHATVERAEARLDRWRSVLAGMRDGSIEVGSREPVDGLPAWVTLQVLRGGFPTGEPAAGGPLRPHELAVIQRVGLRPSRRSLFAYHLSDAGMAELYTLLDSGRYRVTLPEEAALLAVAWLVRAGDGPAALDLLDRLRPFADRLCFTPVPADRPADAETVWRETAGDARARLEARQPDPRVEAKREALTVWNPFADELLALWLETVDDGRVAARTPPEWLERAAALLLRYRRLAKTHTRCRKHRRKKENLAILRAALEDVVAGRPAPGLLGHAVRSMVARRGVPGSDAHASLRARQAAEAALPGHVALALVVAERLRALPQDTGVDVPEAVTGPVQPAEVDEEHTVPAGTAIPRSLVRVVERALTGPVERLIERGVVPSAEVLASLVPKLSAASASTGWIDEPLRRLMAATYVAFRNRRSLLLLNLAHQVRLAELPWVAAVAGFRDDSGDVQERSRATLVRLGELALVGFPATALPNALISELAALSKAAGLDLPWVEELAADIFMGTFSAKFLRAAKIAGTLLRGSVYERYYGIDYDAVLAMPDHDHQRHGTHISLEFDALCRRRAGDATRSLAGNGMVIEQAQILTTHNLATLADPVGAAPADGWVALARRSFDTVCRLVVRLDRGPGRRSTVKKAAYAWRQTLFFLSLADVTELDVFVGHAFDRVFALPAHAADRLGPVVTGLGHLNLGGAFGADGTVGGVGRRFVGGAAGGHWMLAGTSSVAP